MRNEAPRAGLSGVRWYATDPHALDGDLDGLVASVRCVDRSGLAERVAALEGAVAADPEAAFLFDADGRATLIAGGARAAAGLFSTPSIGELRARARERASGAGAARLSVLAGAHVLTDIATLQATAPPGTLFQVASQFDCLESPEACVVPVAEYLSDWTQGPRASISALPGTLLRHYRAPSPDGRRFVQTEDHCINLLEDAFGPEVACVESGYLELHNIHDAGALAELLVSRFERVRVGLHDGVEVMFGHDWGGPVPPEQRIAQAFTSTIALGGYGRDDGSAAVATLRRQLLRAAYLGTLLGAVTLGCRAAVLTLIGGGVFGNPHEDIWDAIVWALAEIDGLGELHVVVNCRESLPEIARAEVRRRGGAEIDLRGR